MSAARVQARGQVTVPRDIRAACGIEPGTDLMFVPTGPDQFECWVMPPRQTLLELLNKYTVEGVAPDLRQLDEEIADEVARRYLLAMSQQQAPEQT